MSTHPISVQLYALRDYLEDLPGTLARLAALGFTAVEPHRAHQDPQGYGRAIRDAGLTAPSMHARFLSDDDDAIAALAADLGVGTVIHPATDPALWDDPGGICAIADSLNHHAALAARHGVRVGYHNHHFELVARHGDQTGLDVLAEALDPAVVLQVDTYWAAVGGVNPVDLLKRLGDRVQLLHVKDGPIVLDAEEQLPVGAGQMPVQEIMQTAPQALRVIEFDAYRGDIFDGLQTSLQYLTEVDR